MKGQRSVRVDITGFKIRPFSNGELHAADSQLNYKYVQMIVGTWTESLSPNIHRSMAVASHGPIRLLSASFCGFAERSRFSRIDPKHYLPQAYVLWGKAAMSNSAAIRCAAFGLAQGYEGWEWQ